MFTLIKYPENGMSASKYAAAVSGLTTPCDIAYHSNTLFDETFYSILEARRLEDSEPFVIPVISGGVLQVIYMNRRQLTQQSGGDVSAEKIRLVLVDWDNIARDDDNTQNTQNTQNMNIFNDTLEYFESSDAWTKLYS